MSGTHVSEWRVLVVEDDETVAAVHCRFVSRQPGFQVIGRAATGTEAMQLVARLRPHLVLLDLGLPGQNGVELLRALRSSSAPVEVIVVTAHATPGIVQVCMQLGAVDYLVKPFWPGRLADALAAFTSRMGALRHRRTLDQDEIDRLRTGRSEPAHAGGPTIKRQRLAEVRDVLTANRVMTADEVGAATGMARVTARRYLEHLVSLGQCTVDTVPHGPGRPRKAYRIWLTGRIGADA